MEHGPQKKFWSLGFNARNASKTMAFFLICHSKWWIDWQSHWVSDIQLCQFVLSALLGNLTKYYRDMKYTNLNKQCLKRTKKVNNPVGRGTNGSCGPMQGALPDSLWIKEIQIKIKVPQKRLQSTPNISKLLQFIWSSSYWGLSYTENDLKGNENYFELAGGSS